MSLGLLLTELTWLLRDIRFRGVAERVVAALEDLPEREVEALRSPHTDKETHERLFEAYWDEFVEPGTAEAVNLGTPESPNVTAYTMSYQGVVIDHLIRLFAGGGKWWERVKELVPIPATSA
jgi:hypothetical protein